MLELLRLVKTELKKLKRKRFVSFVVFAAILFPIPATILAIRGGFGNMSEFDGIFQMLISYAEPIMLPCVLGVISSMLFIMEKDNDTLKNLCVIPISMKKIASAKLCVIFIFGLAFSLLTALSAIVGGLVAGGVISGVFQKLGIAIITGALYSIGTLPVVIAIVFFDKSYIFSIILTVFYSIFGFSLMSVGLGVNTPLMRLLTSIIPAPVIYRWQASLFVTEQASYYEIIKPYFLSLPIVLLVIGIIGGLSFLAIVTIYKKREI